MATIWLTVAQFFASFCWDIHVSVLTFCYLLHSVVMAKDLKTSKSRSDTPQQTQQQVTYLLISTTSRLRRVYLIYNVVVFSLLCLQCLKKYSQVSEVAFSTLTLLVERQGDHPDCKNWVIGCWCGYLSGASCRLFAYGPTDATAIAKPIMSCLI